MAKRPIVRSLPMIAAGADRRAFADQRRQRVLVGVGGAQLLSDRASSPAGKRSLVKIVPALIITPSSIVTPLQM